MFASPSRDTTRPVLSYPPVVPRGIVDAEERRRRKALSALQGRKAQAAARLLLALCARAGEGRRRVLAELYSALSCHAADGGPAAAAAGDGRWGVRKWIHSESGFTARMGQCHLSFFASALKGLVQASWCDVRSARGDSKAEKRSVSSPEPP